jgi:hypothetical protein
MEPKLSITEVLFKKQLKWLIDYFDIKKERNELNPFYKDAYKPLKFIYDIVLNNLKIEGSEYVTFYHPLIDCYIEADDFFNKEEIGILYREVVYYFNNYYKK